MLSVPNWSRVYTGKVHDVYAPIHPLAHSGNEVIMLVTTDRMSVLDRVLPTIIPRKGEIVNTISEWWFDQLADVAPHHYLSDEVPPTVKDRAMVVQRLRMYPIECTVVGYMTRSVFADYERSGRFHGMALPKGLNIGDKLPEPLFCPSIKAAVGADDEPISFERMEEIVGENVADGLRSMSLDLYEAANEIAIGKGLVIADAKLEFGSSSDAGDEKFVFADHAFTPDSATYWIADERQAGDPRSFGKDYVRDAVEADVLAWIDGSGPTPQIPDDVVDEMSARYRYLKSALLGSTHSQGKK